MEDRKALQEELARYHVGEMDKREKKRKHTPMAQRKTPGCKGYRRAEKTKEKIRMTIGRKRATETLKDLYHPFAEQQEIHDALRPMCSGKIAMAITGRRFGKTTLAINEIVDHAVTMPGSRCWYIAHTEKQAFRIAWVEMLEAHVDKDNKMCAPYLPSELVKKKREDQHYVVLNNGSRIEFLGTVQQLPMLGAKLHFVVFDEFPGINYAAWVDIVRPMLIDHRGNALFIGTVPDPIEYSIEIKFIEMYEEFLYGKAENKNYKGFNFSSFCNPHISHEELKQQIKDEERKGRGRNAQRLYYGKYTREYGAAFPKFDYDKHTVEPIKLPGDCVRIMAIDPHPQKPSYALWCAIDKRKHYWFYREMEFVNEERALTIPEIAYEITDVEDQNKEKIHMRLIDPTFAKIEQSILGAKSVNDLFKDYGLWFNEADRRFDTYFHRVKDMLVEEPETTFHILRNCPGFIRQMKNATWDSWGSARARAERGAKDKLKKGDDDYLDNSKYIINAPVAYGMLNDASIATYRSQLNKRWQRQREQSL